MSITELERELQTGIVDRTLEVERAFAIAADDVERRRRAEAMTEGYLLGHQSFQKFCEDVGIINLCDEPQGAYGCDWSHCDYGTLDRELVYNGILSGYVREVYCSRNTAESRDFGQIGHPVLSTCNGMHVALMRVKFDDLGMQVCLKDLEHPEAEEWLSLNQARRLVSKMGGITCEPYGGKNDEDRERGYVRVVSNRKITRHGRKDR